MKTLFATLYLLLGIIAIPIQIQMIIQNERIILYSILLVLTVPGFLLSLSHLMKVVKLKIDFRIEDVD